MRHFVNHDLQNQAGTLSAAEGLPVASKPGAESYGILRLPAVLKARGRSRSTHYCDIQQGLFPRPVKLGDRAVGWPELEVEAMNLARIAGKGEEEIRALVASLVTARKSVSR